MFIYVYSSISGSYFVIPMRSVTKATDIVTNVMVFGSGKMQGYLDIGTWVPSGPIIEIVCRGFASDKSKLST